MEAKHVQFYTYYGRQRWTNRMFDTSWNVKYFVFLFLNKTIINNLLTALESATLKEMKRLRFFFSNVKLPKKENVCYLKNISITCYGHSKDDWRHFSKWIPHKGPFKNIIFHTRNSVLWKSKHKNELNLTKKNRIRFDKITYVLILQRWWQRKIMNKGMSHKLGKSILIVIRTFF